MRTRARGWRTKPFRDVDIQRRLARRLEFANISRKSFAIPDISVAIGCDQVRKILGGDGIFLDLHCSSCRWCVAGDLGRVILREPDVPMNIHGDTIWMTGGCRYRILSKSFYSRIEEPDLVPEILGEPDIPIIVYEDVIGRGVGRWDCPLFPGILATRNEFSDRIGGRLGEPDMSALIHNQEGRAGVCFRLKVILHQ